MRQAQSPRNSGSCATQTPRRQDLPGHEATSPPSGTPLPGRPRRDTRAHTAGVRSWAVGPPRRDPPVHCVGPPQGRSLSAAVCLRLCHDLWIATGTRLQEASAARDRSLCPSEACGSQSSAQWGTPRGSGRVPQGCPGKGRSGTGTRGPRKRQLPCLLPLLILQL